MAETINLTTNGAGAHLPVVTQGYKKFEKTIKMEDVIVANGGTALAADDVIQVFDVPIGANVRNGQIIVTKALDATAVTLHFGSDLDIDQWIQSLDATSAGYGTPLDAAEYFAAANTLDVQIATLTGSITTGTIKVIAIVEDLI